MRILLILVATLTSSINAFYDRNSAVAPLSDMNFDSSLAESELPMMVEFFAPWCGHCQKLVPEYEKAAKASKDLVRFAAIDCDDEKNKRRCGQFGIQGFPTLKLFYFDKTKSKMEVTDYNGARQASSLHEFAMSRLHSYAFNVADGKLQKFLELEGDLPKVLLFTDKEKPAALYDALSVIYKKQAKFGFVKKDQAELARQFSISEYPTILIFSSSDASNFVKYEGKISKDELFVYFKQRLSPEYSGSEAKVTEIKDRKDMEKHCLNQEGYCFLAFLVPDEENLNLHSEQLAVLQNILDKLKDFYRISIVYMNPRQNMDVVNYFGVADNFPGGLFLRPKSKQFRVLTSYFDESEIVKFIKDTIQGLGRVFKYTEFPMKTAQAKDKEEL